MFNDDLRDRLLKSEYAGKKTRTHGGFINGLVCPECGKEEAWAYEKAPYTIICNHMNKCGARTKTIPLFNFAAKVEAKYSPTKEDPIRPARAYLESRGISLEVVEKCGCEYHGKTRNGCGGGVMFQVGTDEKGNKLYNGRLFNPPKGEDKSHNVGAVSGHLWRMPGMAYDPEKETYITEGIIDALSLLTMGLQAVAVLSSVYDPAKFDLSEFRNIVLAFDNDEAGAKATRRWFDHIKKQADGEEQDEGMRGFSQKVSAIMPINGDWNDLLCQSGTPEKAAEKFRESLDRFALQGRLALAESAKQYASVYVAGNDGFAPGLFAFHGQYYWSWVKAAKEEGLAPEIFTERASNFTVFVEHYQRSDADEELPVFLYRLKVMPKNGRPVYITANGNDLKSADGLTGFFLRHGKVLWCGKIDAAKAFAEMVVESKAPVVRQAERTGYDHKTGFYILKDFAIDKKGEKILPDKDGFYKAGAGEYLRPALIETLKPGTCDVAKVYQLLITAWGNNAAVALAFIVASLFVNQVKAVTKFFPFLSLYGDPQTGKSRLMMALNAMQCLDEEGLPMSGANTKKGELRTLAQVSGHTKALIEGNDREKAKFDFESILPLYNHGNPLQTRAQTTNDNRVHTLPFYAALAFVQNREPFTSRAAKERVISLKFSKTDLSESTRKAFEELAGISVQDLAGFYPAVMKGRGFFGTSWKDYFKTAKTDLKGDVPDSRINENHALLLAFHRLLCQHFGIDHDVTGHLASIGKAKMIAVQQRLETPADHFFNILQDMPDEIEGKGEYEGSTLYKKAFWEIKDDKLLLNRAGAEKAIREAGYFLDYPERLGASLQEHPAHIKSSVPHRFAGSKTAVRAHEFDLARLFE